MPGIVALVAAISSDVVTSLAAASYPPIVENKILLGRQHQFAQHAPPRIIFTPTGSAFPMKDVYDRSTVASAAEMAAQRANRSLRNDEITFEVRCWGVSPDQNPDNDYDYTQILYHQVIRSIKLLAEGSFEISNGKWTDATFQSSQLVRDGRVFVFNAMFQTPILERLEPLPYAPSDVAMEATDSLKIPTGLTEPGCEEP